VRFVVLGDYGVGVRKRTRKSVRQQRLAKALARLVHEDHVRLVLTTGDNIYLSAEGGIYGSGVEDDDWFFTYYQPYRYVIDRIPVYPSVGNHDTGDTELSDDRGQLEDNFFLHERFQERHGYRSSLDPGLFYRLDYGSDVVFLCLDTSLAEELPHKHFFEDPRHRKFLETCLARAENHAPRWRIPFGHHPPFCAGPHHDNSAELVEHLVPLLERAGVPLMFSGHEHNFQYSVNNDVHYFVTGAGGALRRGRPRYFEQAHTVAWADEGHFLLVSIEANTCRVELVGADDDGNPRTIHPKSPDGKALEPVITIQL
jgi:hypothetical protein